MADQEQPETVTDSPDQGGLKGILKRFYHRLPQPPSATYLFKVPQNPFALLEPGAKVMDIGSKDAKGSYQVGKVPDDMEFITVDIEPGPGVTLVADAHDLYMVEDNSIDCVTTVSTLEHVRYPQKVVSEIHRVLKPGGVIYLSVPFIYPFHSDPYDFYRFSSDGVDILCENFDRIDSGFNRGPASTMATLLINFNAMLFSFNNENLYLINKFIFGWLLFWIKYLDKFLGHHPNAKVIHAGAYFLGRKPQP